jgi:hypothetical protein
VSSVAIVRAIARHSRARRRYSFALLVTTIVLFARNVTIVRVPKFKTGHCQIQKGPQRVKGGQYPTRGIGPASIHRTARSKALGELSVRDRIRLAKDGERDPSQLCDRAVMLMSR